MKESIENYSPKVKLSEKVPDDKFDKHMKEARKKSLQARRVIFENQSETAGNRSERYANIKSSIY